MTGLLIRDCDVDGTGRCDVRVRDGALVEIGPGLRPDDDDVLLAHGGALIPGLHDHHVHVLALAASLASVDCSPAAVPRADDLVAALRAASARGPVRGVGYFESVAGSLDRAALDAIVSRVPVRVQHRSGAAWFLNSAAMASYGLLDSVNAAVERDLSGEATGRVFRGDDLFRRPDTAPPALRDVGRLLASYGVTGVTDATPRLANAQAWALRAAHRTGDLPQHLLLLGATLRDPRAAGVPWKVVVDEVAGLDPIAVVDDIRAAHAAGRPAALHCTSRAECVLAVDALRVAGVLPGDRLEHGGVMPAELDAELARAQVTVVTQPHFIRERGDGYLADVEPADHELLYRCGSLLDAGVRVAAGTDAPFGRPDPWAAIAAAASRSTSTGTVIADRERVSAQRALELFLGDPLDPGGEPRRVGVGAPADLCLLDVPKATALSAPSATRVAATVIGGTVVFRRDALRP